MILVTGATGYVGRHVVNILRKFKLDVRALVRKGSEYYWLNDTGCSYFFGDLRDPESIHRALRDVRYVVVCSGISVATSENHHNNMTDEGHAALFAAAQKRGVERIVLLSCMGAGLDEPVPRFRAQRRAEEQLASSGVDYTILRACAHEHMFLDLAWLMAKGSAVRLPELQDNQLSVIGTTDLALLCAASLDLESTRNQTITVGGPTTLSSRAVLQMACETVGTSLQSRPMSASVIAVGSRFGRPVRRYLHRLAELQVWFSRDLVCDYPTLEQQFGFALKPIAPIMVESNERIKILRDPELRRKQMVHPQFYATIYKPGTANLNELLDGPSPRRD